jgi:hypothetical protein
MDNMTDMPTPADLVGAWQLDNWRITFSDDRPDTYPYGDDAKGFLIYEASGRMSVMVSNADRPQMSDANIRRAPVEEKVAAFDSFFGYTGRWRLEGDHMVHSVEMALNPNFVGTDQVRGIEYAPGSLTLIEQSTTRTGAVMRNQLAWRKIS